MTISVPESTNGTIEAERRKSEQIDSEAVVERVNDLLHSYEETNDFGTRLMHSIIHSDSWRLRRVEHLELSDPHEIRRNVSLDFLIPSPDKRILYSELELSSRGSDQVIVPITFLKKELLSDFNIRDGAGHAMSILLSEENSVLSTLFLLELLGWRSLADRDATLENCVSIVTGKNRADACNELLKNVKIADESKKEVLPFYAERLMDTFILFALVPLSGLSRRILKFSYSDMPSLDPPVAAGKEDVHEEPGGRLRAWKDMYFKDLGETKYEGIQFESIGSARSFQAEICTPAPIVICREPSVVVNSRSESDFVHCDQACGSRRIHLSCRGMVDAQGVTVGFTVLVVTFSGAVFAAFFGLITVFIGSLAILIHNIFQRATLTDGSLPILLIVPASLSLLLSHDDEQHMITATLRPFRYMGWGSALLMILLAAGIAFSGLLVVTTLSGLCLLISILGIAATLKWFGKRKRVLITKVP